MLHDTSGQVRSMQPSAVKCGRGGSGRGPAANCHSCGRAATQTAVAVSPLVMPRVGFMGMHRRQV